jgi:transcriptional regulator with XRE-family HTH domain
MLENEHNRGLMSITEVFGKNVRKIRGKRILSQEELAFSSGLHRTYIGSVERGERNITLVNAQKIADALQVPLRDLFEEEQ